MLGSVYFLFKLTQELKIRPKLDNFLCGWCVYLLISYFNQLKSILKESNSELHVIITSMSECTNWCQAVTIDFSH